jgi:carbamoyl-phosphate synthase small subunit
MLEDGRSFSAEALCAGETIGEVIMNTAVVGYQEMMTDPANAGKILVLTYPLIGNYGIALKFNESKKIWLAGMVIKEKARFFSNWQAKESLDDFVKEQKLLLVSKVDTRTLAVHLRQKGEQLGIISTSCLDTKELLAKLRVFKGRVKMLPEISRKKISRLGGKNKDKRTAVLDLGLTNSTLSQLQALGLSLTILPYNASSRQIMRDRPQGLILSSGPEEDPGLAETVENIKPLIGKLPILGLGAGHQVLCRALGAKFTRMKLGHRGVNYPIHNPVSYKGEITVQNHCWTADAESLGKIKALKISAYNLNDRSVEEIESKKLKILGAQYIPASPGFGEVNPLFKRFLKLRSK